MKKGCHLRMTCYSITNELLQTFRWGSPSESFDFSLLWLNSILSTMTYMVQPGNKQQRLFSSQHQWEWKAAAPVSPAWWLSFSRKAPGFTYFWHFTFIAWGHWLDCGNGAVAGAVRWLQETLCSTVLPLGPSHFPLCGLTAFIGAEGHCTVKQVADIQ